ncbi:Holliday junction branch migration protein RuvA [Spirochaeta lutea]|uniref:Holliday junction branch migration protein RuvA n=1 Tax=Spirochaeta lutea TaxID=1480694 RepID=UPI00069081F1|nr:Holliday junction branch migration protein RuvA [Spirochaeta lutea]
MIYRIRGTIEELLEGVVVLEQGGVSFQLEVSQTTLGVLAQIQSKQSETSLYTYLHVREDLLQLYGFASLQEKEVFLALLSVSGIGPKQALKILSGISPEDFISVIEREDIKHLESLPGLGKKTAQKILLALAGKLYLEHPAGEKSPRSKLPQTIDAIATALIEMGFERRVVITALPEIGTTILGELHPELTNLASLEKLPSGERNAFEGELMRRAIIELS